jgi:hypothetical protein
VGSAALDVHAPEPGPRAIGIAGEVDQRAPIQEDGMAHAPDVRRDPLRGPPAWRDAPDVHLVRWMTPDEVDELPVGRPQRKVAVEPGGSGEDGPTLRWAAAVGHEQRVSGCGSVVHESGAVARPVELRDAFEVRPRLSAQRWHRPDADGAIVRAVVLASPERDEGAIGREGQVAHRQVDELGRAAVGQVVELPGTDLRHPDVNRSVPVRQEGDEVTVPRHRSGRHDSVEVSDGLESGVGDGGSPEVLRPLKPEACADREGGPRRRQRQDERSNGWSLRSRRWRRGWRGNDREDALPVLLRRPKVPTPRPCVQFLSGTRRPSPSGRAGAGERASPPASPSAGPSSRRG